MSSDREREAEKIIKRLLLFKCPFDALEVPIGVPEEELNKKYKKISLYIHPDKCKHPKASEALNQLKKFLEIIKDEDIRKQYERVMEQSREMVTKDWQKDGHKKLNRLEEKAFELDVVKMTQKLLIEIEKNTKRAEEMRLANERFEKEQRMEEEEQERQRVEYEKKWEEARFNRVDSWRSWQQKDRRFRIAKEQQRRDEEGEEERKRKAEAMAQRREPPKEKIPMLGVEPPKKKKKKFIPQGLKPPKARLSNLDPL